MLITQMLFFTSYNFSMYIHRSVLQLTSTEVLRRVAGTDKALWEMQKMLHLPIWKIVTVSAKNTEVSTLLLHNGICTLYNEPIPHCPHHGVLTFTGVPTCDPTTWCLWCLSFLYCRYTWVSCWPAPPLRLAVRRLAARWAGMESCNTHILHSTI